MTLDDELRAMRQHTLDNPQHGLNCSCKDANLGRIRTTLREGLLFEELQYVASIMGGEFNVRCGQCFDKKQYWTEWSDAAMRDEYLMSLVIEAPTDEPLALIHCPACGPIPRPCTHLDNCSGNHTTASSGFFCNHLDTCERIHV